FFPGPRPPPPPPPPPIPGRRLAPKPTHDRRAQHGGDAEPQRAQPMETPMRPVLNKIIPRAKLQQVERGRSPALLAILARLAGSRDEGHSQQPSGGEQEPGP